MKYTGSLGKTIAQKRMGLLHGEDECQAEAKRTTDEMLSKLPALFKAHDAIEGNFVALTLALAKAHVPGFKVVKPAGRKTEWNITDRAEFKLDVDAIVLKSGVLLPVTEAIKMACRSEAWAGKTKPMSLAAVTRHYYKADLGLLKS